MRYAATGALLAALIGIVCQDPPQEEPVGSSDENTIAIPAPDPPPNEPRVLEAISEATETVASNPDSARAWGTLGMVFDAHSYLPEAVRCYRQALQLTPDDYRWNYHLAITLDHEAGDIEEVMRLFEKASRRRGAPLPSRCRPPGSRALRGCISFDRVDTTTLLLLG